MATSFMPVAAALAMNDLPRPTPITPTRISLVKDRFVLPIQVHSRIGTDPVSAFTDNRLPPTDYRSHRPSEQLNSRGPLPK